MSRCFNFSPLLVAFALIAMPFTVSAKTAVPIKAPAKSTVKSASKSASAARSTAKKTVSAKNNVKPVSGKTVKQVAGPKPVAKTSGKTATAKAVNTKNTVRASGRKQAAKTAKKQTVNKKATPSMRVTTLKAGGKSIKVEVASTEAEYERGLMYRKSLPADNGMLFDFKGPAKTCMWMKDTYIPLSVAFIDVNGKVVNIEEMKAQTTTSHCSKNWIRYALEMNAKWFSRHGVRPGSRITGLPR
ncbi:MAG: DUF192 domain-containing protein [Oxalobacter sp.]